jgi:hypothetical protein
MGSGALHLPQPNLIDTDGPGDTTYHDDTTVLGLRR